MTRKRRTNRQIFLEALEEISNGEQLFIGRNELINKRRWEPEKYNRIREELINEGSVIATRGGPGGKISLAHAKSAKGLSVFVSYSHADTAFKDELIKHLKPLEQMRLISAWHDGKIQPGDKWNNTLMEALNKCDMVLLLASIDFINSKFCYEIELERAIEREAAGEIVIIPILIRQCIWSHTPFAKFQALPKEAKAVAGWPDKDEALAMLPRE